MLSTASSMFLLNVSIVLFIFVLFAAALFIGVPYFWANLASSRDQSRIDNEDRIREILVKIVGFPFAAVTVATACIALFQGVSSYSASKITEYQNQYQHAFEDLASKSVATRIGGLYILKTLLHNYEENTLPFQLKPDKENEQALLRALAGFSVDHAASDTGIVKPDSLVALQIIAYNQTLYYTGVDLRNGKFPGSILADDPNGKKANFSNSDFYSADLSGSGLYKANFFQTNLRRANLNGSNMVLADLSHAGLSNARFCPGQNYAVPELIHDYAVRTQLSEANLQYSYGEDTLFDGAWMDKAILRNSTLIRPTFLSTELYAADFSNATLEKPDFSHAWLQLTVFKGAKLTAPKFDGAFLEDVDMRELGLTDDVLQGAHYCRAIMPSGIIRSDDCASETQLHLPNSSQRLNINISAGCAEK